MTRLIIEPLLLKGYLLSAAVSPSKKVADQGYNVPSIAKDLDWIAIMAYDYHGHWDKKTGHVAPMFDHPKGAQYLNAVLNYTIEAWDINLFFLSSSWPEEFTTHVFFFILKTNLTKNKRA